MALFLNFRILNYHGTHYRSVSIHCSERNAIFVHIHTDNRVCIVLAGDSVTLVRDGDVESPFIVLIHDFSGANSPFLVGEGGSQSVEVVRTTAKCAFDVRASCGSDTESNRPVVLGEQPVAFLVIHHHRVRLVDVWVWPTPPIIIVVVIRFDFTECLVNEKLGGVVDVIGIGTDS